MDNWNPATTAPKDGSILLAWAIECRSQIDDEHPVARRAFVQWTDQDDSEGADWWIELGSFYSPQQVRISHWMPAPQPPAA